MAVINVLIISVPLIFVDIQLHDYLNNPNIWAYYLLMTIFCFMESKFSLHFNDIRHSSPENAFLPYMMGGCVLLIFWVSIYDYTNHFQSHLIQLIVGCLLIMIGLTIRLISIKKLHIFFVSHVAYVKSHQLITTGIYSVIRHPSELGLLSICFGVVMLLSSLTGLLMIVFALVPLVIYRIVLEDKLLLALFSSDYEKYKAETPSLLPKLMFNGINKI